MTLKFRLYASAVVERISKNGRNRVVYLCAEGFIDYPADGFKARYYSIDRVIGTYADGCTVAQIVEDMEEMVKDMMVPTRGAK